MKKTYILSSEDGQFSVELARRQDETMLVIDGERELPVDAKVVLGGKAISLIQGGRQHLIHLTGLDRRGKVAATIDGRPVVLTVMDELRAKALDSLGAGGGSGTLAADIPGLVVEIKVQPGQKVHQGEPLIVVEAMKMQNELTAGVAGTVKEIPVRTGQSVNPGDPLVIIEPEAGG